MKRTKQLESVIKATNEYLRANKIKDEGDPAFNVLHFSLLQMGTYKGFNYFKDLKIGDTVVPVCAGSSTDFEYLQLY